MTTRPPTRVATHHCLYCGSGLYRDDPENPWENRAGQWRCFRHPRKGQSKLIPHMAIPSAP